MQTNTKDAARHKWHGILMNVGVNQEFLKNRHGPCPLCGGRDRFRFDDKEGNGTWYCNQCGPGDGMSLVMKLTGKDFKDAARQVDEILGNVDIKPGKPKPKQDPARRLNAIKAKLLPPQGSPVETYLASRGLKLPESGVAYIERIRHIQDGKTTTWPAMVSTYRNASGHPISLHVTYLTPGGDKAPVTPDRKMMPPTESLNGGCISLTAPGKVLGIAEGVETALSAHSGLQVPCWAATSANQMMTWIPPEGVEEVAVFGDNDASYTGQMAAYTLANRLRKKGYTVTVHIPDIRGDWNDVLVNQL